MTRMLAVCLLVAPLVPAAGQGVEPLRKSDLVQLLTERTLPTAEIAGLIRRNCLTFRPTERDLADLQAIGADAAVLAGITDCLRRRGGESAPRARRAGESALRVLPSLARVTARAGSQVSVVVDVLRGTTPQGGRALVLRGSAAIPGGLAEDARAVTNPRGVAAFELAAGTRVGTYPLTIAATDGTPLVGQAAITLVTTAGAATTVVVTPPQLVLVPRASNRAVAIRVEVRDAFGNAVMGERVELRSRPPAVVLGVPVRVTNAAGEAAFTLSAARAAAAVAIDVYVREKALGVLGVARGAGAPSADHTSFVAGVGQRGPAGATLPELLVFEVRDSSRMPVVEELVTFMAPNARVEPAKASTDSLGRVAVRVTLGERAGAADVRAAVAGISRSAPLRAEAGPAAEFLVERDGAPVAGVISVGSRNAVTLRVRARDAFGNAVPVDAVEIAAGNRRVARVRSALAADTSSSVTLEPVRAGVTELEIRAGGGATRRRLEVSLPPPARWTVGLGFSLVGFDYTFPWAPTEVESRPGFAFDGSAGFAPSRHVRLIVGGGVGAVAADTGGGGGAGAGKVSLVQGYFRTEFAFSAEAAFTPVLALGGGGYRLNGALQHTSLFWTVGGGADIALGPGTRAEIRILNQRLEEVSSPIQKGHVGSLIWMGAGVRLRL